MKIVSAIASIAFTIEEVAKMYLNTMTHHINTIQTILANIVSHHCWLQAKKKTLILKRRKAAARHKSKLLVKILQVEKQMSRKISRKVFTEPEAWVHSQNSRKKSAML